MYAKVQDGFVVDTKNHLYNITSEDLVLEGWMPLTYTNELPTDKYVVVSSTFTVEEDTVIGTYQTEPVSLEQAKVIKKEEINKSWANAVQNGAFTSSTIENFVVDCRRNQTDNDIQNIDGIIGLISANIIQEPVAWKGVFKTRELLLSDLMALKIEMLGYGAQVYQKKFTAFAAIEAAETVEDVKVINF